MKHRRLFSSDSIICVFQNHNSHDWKNKPVLVFDNAVGKVWSFLGNRTGTSLMLVWFKMITLFGDLQCHGSNNTYLVLG